MNSDGLFALRCSSSTARSPSWTRSSPEHSETRSITPSTFSSSSATPIWSAYAANSALAPASSSVRVLLNRSNAMTRAYKTSP